MGIQKIKLFYGQLLGTLHSLPDSWLCAALVHIEQVQDGTKPPNVEQCCNIIVLVKEKVKPAEIVRRLNAQYGKETLSCTDVYDLYNKFSEGQK
jgi:hypothetical protein